MISETKQKIILDRLASLNPISVAVFGSYARGDQRDDSDLDILVDTQAHYSLLDLIDLEQQLTEALGTKVDLVTKRSLSPYFKPYIENNLVYLHAAG